MSTHSDLFNLSLLEEMDDDEYLSDILGIFLANTPGELNTLEEACSSQQFDTAYKMAHKLKSCVGLLQAPHLMAALLSVEEAAKAQKVEGLSGLCTALQDAYKKIEMPLQTVLTNIKTG